MKVTVDPHRPISGILPKNKMISEKTELDLNRAEIVRCTQFGTVYDEDMNVIDIDNIDRLFKQTNKKELFNHIDFNLTEKDITIPPVQEKIKTPLPLNNEETTEESKSDTVFYMINKLPVEKDGNRIILPFEFKI